MKALKKVPGDKKGLSKLPTAVRNKMGYMKDGGKVKPKKKGMSTAERKERYMNALKEKQDAEKKALREKNASSLRRSYGSTRLFGPSIEETAKFVSGALDNFEAKQEEKKYKPQREAASKKFDEATKYDEMLGRATNPDKKYEKGGKVKKGKKPNYKKTETFQDYKSAAATFQDFDPGKDTVFVGTSIDPGVADKKAQRQANISSSKGASKSNYNDSKMYRTKNEAGQDVYVSLRKYDKYKKGGKVFKPHNMYKDGKVVKAKSMADHLRLKKQGYSHKKG